MLTFVGARSSNIRAIPIFPNTITSNIIYFQIYRLYHLNGLYCILLCCWNCYSNSNGVDAIISWTKLYWKIPLMVMHVCFCENRFKLHFYSIYTLAINRWDGQSPYLYDSIAKDQIIFFFGHIKRETKFERNMRDWTCVTKCAWPKCFRTVFRGESVAPPPRDATHYINTTVSTITSVYFVHFRLKFSIFRQICDLTKLTK